MDVSEISALFERAVAEIGKVVVGQPELVEATLVALFCEGNVLIEGVPGLGKTLLVNTLSRTLNCRFRRIQFTPDLMPSDITGHSIYDMQERKFNFNAGPLFTNLLLADEINRAPAKTQSALLEAMQERQVTIDGATHALPRPFLVLATQNPVELEGTFPLPEAQLDRFMLRLELGYPAAEEEVAILERYEQTEPLENLVPVADAAAVLEQQHAIRSVPFSMTG